MVPTTRSFCSLLLTCGIPAVFAFPQTPVPTELAEALQARLDSCRTAFDVPGISATLLFPGGYMWNGATGVAHIGTLAPMDTSYLFQAASTTKMLTAAVVMQLVEEGLLDLDEPIGNHLPPLPNIAPEIPLRLLLRHRSGLADYLYTPGASDNWFTTPALAWSPQKIIEQYSAPPLFSPNAAFHYSNTNYLLLGMIVEAVTGQAFHTVLQERILEPLQLEEAYFPPAIPIEGEVTPGWTSFQSINVFDTDATPILGDCFSSFGFSAGALVCRPWELALATRAINDGSLLQATSLAAMRTFGTVSFSDGANGYGLGLMRYTYAGRSYLGHGGDISGFTQHAIHGIDDGITLVVSINRNNAPRGLISAALLATVYQVGAVNIDEATRYTPPIEVYPVPVATELIIRSELLRRTDLIEIVDAMGRTVLRTTAGHAYEQVIDAEHLPAGSYTVVLWSGDRRVTRRFVKE